MHKYRTGTKVRIHKNWGKHLPWVVFSVLFTLSGVTSALMLPAGAGMDEPSHVNRTMQVTVGQFLPVKVDQGLIDPETSTYANEEETLYGGVVDEGVADQAIHGMREFQLKQEHYSFPAWNDTRLNMNLKFGISTGQRVFSNTVVNNPILYVPQALAFSLATMITDSAYWSIIAMRLAGILFIVLAGSFAIYLIPFGKWVLSSILLLPGTIMINSMVTADTVTTGVAVIFFAMVIRALNNDKINNWEWTILGVSGLLLGTVKMTYVPLLGLLLLLPILKAEYRTQKTLLKLSSIILCTSVLLLTWFFVVKNINTGAMYSREVFPPRQTEFLASNLPVFLKALFTQIISQNYFLFGDFGVLNVHGIISTSGAGILLLIVVSMIITACEPKSSILVHHGWLLLLTCVSIFIVIFTLVGYALYTQFTPVGNSQILGIQSRYFIPVLPLFLVPFVVLSHINVKRRGGQVQVIESAAPIDLVVVQIGLMFAIVGFTVFQVFYTLY